MNWIEFNEAVEDAESTILKGNAAIRKLAHLCKGRLRLAGVGFSTLAALKKELSDFNMHTGKWKDTE